jgi:hypothetical protein
MADGSADDATGRGSAQCAYPGALFARGNFAPGATDDQQRDQADRGLIKPAQFHKSSLTLCPSHCKVVGFFR